MMEDMKALLDQSKTSLQTGKARVQHGEWVDLGNGLEQRITLGVNYARQETRLKKAPRGRGRA